jgi:hypothetical protein
MQRFTRFTQVLTLAIVTTALSLLFSPTSFAADTNDVCASGCEYTSVADAVVGEASGSTITVRDTQTITTAVVVNKSVTITGASGGAINTSGTDHTFITTAPNVTISNLVFTKTDSADQNMINIQGANTTISGNSFTGQFVFGAGEVSRALEVSTTTGLNVTGNTFSHLRQPAYINDDVTGTITNNSTSTTKGWVILSTTSLIFSGNTWGENVIDIAITAGASNNYPDATVVAMSDNNNDAVVENQFGGIKRLSDAYVIPVANGRSGDDGSKWNPYTSVQNGLDRIVSGGTVHVANGTYTEALQLNVVGTKLVGASRGGVVIKPTSNAYGQGLTSEGVNDITIRNLTIQASAAPFTGNAAIKIHNVNGLTIDNVSVLGAGKTLATAKTTGIDLNGVSNVVISNVTVQDFYKNGISITNRQLATEIASANINLSGVTLNNNGWAGLTFYLRNASNADITNVTISGLAASGNGVAVQFGDPGDTKGVYGPGGATVSLGAAQLALAGGPLYIANNVVSDVDARSVVFDGKMSENMTDAEVVARDAAITDKKDVPAYGTVQLAAQVTPVTPGSGTGTGTTSTPTTTSSNVVAANRSTANGGTGSGNGSSGATDTGSDETSQVLGDASSSDRAKVSGVSTDNSPAKDTKSTTGDGLQWFWWLLLVVAALAALWWFLVARRRNKDEE